ncbi:MAG: hypothetical protein PHR53_04380 [Bacteroidales bacterium]|nr:hypothetical protein [Bacteroidales bacterium]
MENQHKINRNNYEIFFLDYSEGNLSQEDSILLMRFLQENPDLKMEWETFIADDLESLKPDKSIVFEGRNQLKKSFINAIGSINENNYTTRFIAFYEGDLSEQEQDEIFDFIAKNPHLKNEFEQFEKTFLQPDKKIVFTDKDSLKKSQKIPFYRLFSYSVAAIAAVFALFFLFKFFIQPITTPTQQSLVQEEIDSIITPASSKNILVEEKEMAVQEEITPSPTMGITNDEPIKNHNSRYNNKVRSTNETIATLELRSCEKIDLAPTPVQFNYRYEAAQLAQDIETAKMLQEQSSSSEEPENNLSRLVKSLFYAAEKTAISTGQLAKN